MTHLTLKDLREAENYYNRWVVGQEYKRGLETVKDQRDMLAYEEEEMPLTKFWARKIYQERDKV